MLPAHKIHDCLAVIQPGAAFVIASWLEGPTAANVSEPWLLDQTLRRLAQLAAFSVGGAVSALP